MPKKRESPFKNRFPFHQGHKFIKHVFYINARGRERGGRLTWRTNRAGRRWLSHRRRTIIRTTRIAEDLLRPPLGSVALCVLRVCLKTTKVELVTTWCDTHGLIRTIDESGHGIINIGIVHIYTHTHIHIMLFRSDDIVSHWCGRWCWPCVSTALERGEPKEDSVVHTLLGFIMGNDWYCGQNTYWLRAFGPSIIRWTIE